MGAYGSYFSGSTVVTLSYGRTVHYTHGSI